jgi:WXG100 family type VII secretion target
MAVAFTVTAEQLDKFASYCNQQVQDIQQAVHQLQGYIQELEATYKGPAALQLQQDIVDLKNDSQQMQVAMADITNCLQANSHNYTTNETQNVSNLAAVKAALGATAIRA